VGPAHFHSRYSTLLFLATSKRTYSPDRCSGLFGDEQAGTVRRSEADADEKTGRKGEIEFLNVPRNLQCRCRRPRGFPE